MSGWIAASLATGLLLLASGASEAAVVRAEAEPRGLQATIDAAAPGDVIEIPPGTSAGPILVNKSVVLRGRGGRIDGGGHGTALTLDAPGVRVEGVRVANSGRDVGGPDACIFVTPRATAAVIQDNVLETCAFGIWVHETDGVHILRNLIEGQPDQRVADRGNGIHLFDASHLVVRGNRVSDSRDGIYVSATEDSLIEDNVTESQRFGVHYMYSYRNTLRGNRSNDNVVGLALMESHHLIVENNEALGNQRNGILFRDVQFSRIAGNRLERNGIGMFFFSSTENELERNRIAHNEVGLKVWAGTRRNRVVENHIVGNAQQVFYVGAEDQVWGAEGRGNRWGDYVGWDQDADGVGDRPHRVESFKSRLLYQFPASALLMRSPALEMLAHLAERLPLLRTPTIVDQSPLTVGTP